LTPRPAFLGEALSAGLLFLCGPVAGWFLGQWLGDLAGVGRVPAWIGAVLGLVSAFVHLFRLTSRMSK
jgi:hypothetical protein